MDVTPARRAAQTLRLLHEYVEDLLQLRPLIEYVVDLDDKILAKEQALREGERAVEQVQAALATARTERRDLETVLTRLRQDRALAHREHHEALTTERQALAREQRRVAEVQDQIRAAEHELTEFRAKIERAHQQALQRIGPQP